MTPRPPEPQAAPMAFPFPAAVLADDPCMAAWAEVATPQADQYYRARYYDPRAGRFISEDPIGLGGGLNFYAYVVSNPVNLRDPYGLDPWTAAQQATHLSEEYRRWDTPRNTEQDALRHCIWSCIMTNEMGKTAAGFAAWVREKSADWSTPSQEAGEREMDDRNNRCGRQAAGDGGAKTPEECGRQCYLMLLRGDLTPNYDSGTTRPYR